MSKIRVMIVDDAVFMRMTLRKILESEGIEVVAEADSGKTAVPLYQKIMPDIVTLDLSMPNMDGMEALDKILRINSEALVIMVSAAGQRSNVLNAIKNGAKSFIVKPFNKDSIISTIKKVVGQKPKVEDDSFVIVEEDSSEEEESIEYSDIIKRFMESSELEESDVTRIFDGFLGKIHEYLTNYDDSIKNSDFNSVKEISHQLKGTLANFQIKSFSRMASEIEKKAVNKDIEGIKELYSNFSMHLLKLKKPEMI